MGSWPELPTPGRFVALPIDVAPTLRAALGDDGGRNWLALHWDGGRQACVWSDDAKTMHTADPMVWAIVTPAPRDAPDPRALPARRQHPDGRALAVV
jgi:hypothetical protein